MKKELPCFRLKFKRQSKDNNLTLKQLNNGGKMINKAKLFALEKHAGQMYGNKPYEYHLQGVVDNLTSRDEEVIAIAWLHDIMEDTTVGFV